jgi:hypothetical protein
MVDPDLHVANGGRVKNGFLKSFVAPGGYRDLKINPVMKGTGMVVEVRPFLIPALQTPMFVCKSTLLLS